jgi:hypothetical protein
MIATRVARRVANRIDGKIAEPVDPEQDVALRCALPRLQSWNHSQGQNSGCTKA